MRVYNEIDVRIPENLFTTEIIVPGRIKHSFVFLQKIDDCICRDALHDTPGRPPGRSQEQILFSSVYLSCLDRRICVDKLDISVPFDSIGLKDSMKIPFISSFTSSDNS